MNPPTPKGAGVRVDLETKRKFIVDYREAMKLVVKCSLRRARGQGAGWHLVYTRPFSSPAYLQ